MPDDVDGWVFNDDFVRAGRHEPSARTREAIAHFGGRRTSWRQPGDPVGALPARRSRRKSKRWLVTSLVVLGSCAVFGTWLQHDHGAGTIPAGAQRVFATGHTISAYPPSGTVSTQPDSTANEVHGITPATAVGSCFSTAPGAASPSHTGPIDLTTTACAHPHTFELVAIEQASGSASLPDASYWHGPVADACQRAFASYTGRGTWVTPDGRASSFFRPTPTGWAQGDRTVFCVASSATAVGGSVRAGGSR